MPDQTNHNTPKPKHPGGRPSLYTPELAEEICERIAEGNSLLKICAECPDVPDYRTIGRWLASNEQFRLIYARARERWADHEFDRMVEIADTPQVGEKTKTLPDGKVEITTGDMTEHRKLQVDTRKWCLARLHPRKYGERWGVGLDPNSDGATLTVRARPDLRALGPERLARLREIVAEAEAEAGPSASPQTDQENRDDTDIINQGSRISYS